LTEISLVFEMPEQIKQTSALGRLFVLALQNSEAKRELKDEKKTNVKSVDNLRAYFVAFAARGATEKRKRK
jgi:hypothetical protein